MRPDSRSNRAFSIPPPTMQTSPERRTETSTVLKSSTINPGLGGPQRLAMLFCHKIRQQLYLGRREGRIAHQQRISPAPFLIREKSTTVLPAIPAIAAQRRLLS